MACAPSERAAFLIIVAWFAHGGCASIHSVESATDTPLHPLEHHETEKGSTEYEVVSSNVSGYTLNATIEQDEACTTVTTPRVHRRRHVARSEDSSSARATWGLAIASFGAGAYGYADADALASRSTNDTSADQYRQYSIGLITLGAAAVLVGVIDAVRAADSDFDDGMINGRPTRQTSACHRQRSRNTEVSLALGSDHFLHAHTDADGIAKFSFFDVPEDQLPTLSKRTMVVVDGHEFEVRDFEARAISDIRDALLADPRSELSIEILERRRDACNRAVSAARAEVPSEPADVYEHARSSWLAAKSTCTDLWTASLDAELTAVEVRIVDSECRHRLERAASAFVDDSGTTVEEMTDELTALHERCTSRESLSKLRALDASLAAVVKRLEREAAAEARQAAREKAQAAAALRAERERARAQQSSDDSTPSWPSSTRSCCKICSVGKACGNSCIASWKTCHKGVGCACDE